MSLSDRESYLNNVQHAILFLESKNNEIIDDLVKKMDKASIEQQYELAARYRDQIVSLRRISRKTIY